MAPSDAGTATAGSGRSGLARWLPIVGWLREYDRGWLLPDGIAGVTVWVLMVPEAMAYAGIAGVPVQYRAVRHPAGSARLCDQRQQPRAGRRPERFGRGAVGPSRRRGSGRQGTAAPW